MTGYRTGELAQDYEFKILRSATGAFRRPERLHQILDEEAGCGWTLVERFDDSRLRLKRRGAVDGPLDLAALLGSATIGGVFFAFSTFVMRALAQLPTAQGVAAMQRINVVVLTPAFLGVFVGTAVLAAAIAVLALAGWDPARSPWRLAAALLYIVGTFGVTMACNVPRNARLAALPADSPDALAYWPVYVREWTAWNTVRTAAALAAAACLALA